MSCPYLLYDRGKTTVNLFGWSLWPLWNRFISPRIWNTYEFHANTCFDKLNNNFQQRDAQIWNLKLNCLFQLPTFHDYSTDNTCKHLLSTYILWKNNTLIRKLMNITKKSLSIVFFLFGVFSCVFMWLFDVWCLFLVFFSCGFHVCSCVVFFFVSFSCWEWLENIARTQYLLL